MAPRKHIQTPGEKLVTDIRAEMTEAGAEPEAKEVALLATAQQIVDRMDALQQVIERDGELLTSKTGAVRVHPAVVEHRQLAATLPKILTGINVNPPNVIPKDATKQRAANSRWERVRQQESLQERRRRLTGDVP